MTHAATLTRKGQVTIPKDVRERLGIKSGARVTFTLVHNDTIVLRVKRRSVMELGGLLYRKGRKPVSIARMAR
jgi:AbrB family looped-hinge helix DNA binding protein